jgi:fatty acid-binding protein DegV
MAEKKAKDLGYQKVSWIKTGCVITTHGGPGAFGIAGYSES